MAILVQSLNGWVLRPHSPTEEVYSRCIRWRRRGDTPEEVKCCFKKQYFQISQSHYTVKVNGDDTIQKTGKAAKKRKRKHTELNQGEIDAAAFHEKIRCVVLTGTQSLLDLARALGHLSRTANAASERLEFPDCGLAGLCDMAKELPLVDEEDPVCSQPLVTEAGDTSHLDLFSRVTENKMDRGVLVSLLGEEYVIPPHASFLLSDLTRIQPLVKDGKTFDLMVLDPPWENKSVKRSRRYSCLPSSQLKQLPVPLLASPDCLVVTWVTNRPSHLRFVCEELYPHWGVEVLAEWYWVKVTTAGEFVFPLDSPHKKPYEVLVLGRCRSSVSNTTRSEVESGRLIVSVPSTLHSQKPSLSDVLKPYVPAGASCLELFARSLQPGWTSWGNEVLKFQHVSYFTQSAPEDEGSGAAGCDPVGKPC
ncbi:N(6)-adenine-specific methyltransferase METTL4 [Synchiropus splendidus]|uniref:N(6)-adenine-specific methyltransferase METTL4 n=1 Tax=Synchiropus splendidus TaxID=270530 RepID=UPI00237EBEB8|nr:N(6)-adenine-specific methyltransferase METTL4 [Synchiropus splendidus]